MGRSTCVSCASRPWVQNRVQLWAAAHGPSLARCSALVVAVQAPGTGAFSVDVHPDLPDDAFPLLQPLGALQFLRRCEDVLVQSPLEAAVSPDRQVGCCVQAAILAVAAVTAALRLLQDLLPGMPPTVCVARDPHYQGSQGEDQPDAHAANKVQSCSLWVLCRRRKRKKALKDAASISRQQT